MPGVLRRLDVAVTDHRDLLNRGHHFGDAVEPGMAAEHHLRRAAVNRHQRHADLFQPFGEVGRDNARIVPAQPQLAGERHVPQDGLDLLYHPQRLVRIAQQLAAAVALGDLVDRAAHVDVDDVCPAVLRPAGGLAEPIDIAAV